MSYYDVDRITKLVVSRSRSVKRSTPIPAEYAKAAALREGLRAFHRESDAVTTANGLTPRTYQLLLMIKSARDGSETLGLGELEERLQLGRSTVTELVLRTEERGLLRRELDRNRRGAIAISLTSEGEARLAATVLQLRDERDRLIALLAELAESAPSRLPAAASRRSRKVRGT